MSKSTIKDLRLRADAIINEGIKNKEQLCAALPTLIEFQNGIKEFAKLVKETREVAAALSDICSDYAAAHPDYVFGDTVSVSPNGVTSGDITIDDETYHFIDGFEGFKRIDEKHNMTQEFLKTLPADWVKNELVLATTVVGKESDMDITEAGLMRKPKRTWSPLA